MRDWLSTDLVQQAKRGNQEAYTELIRRHSKHVFAVCMGVLGDAHEAEDLTQEVFITAYREMNRLRKEEQFQQWLDKIAKNRCIDWLRRKSKMKQIIDDKKYIAEDRPVEFESLNDALGQIDEMYRLPLTLFYFEGQDCQKVGKALGVGTATARTRISRARKLLRDILSRQEGQNG